MTTHRHLARLRSCSLFLALRHPDAVLARFALAAAASAARALLVVVTPAKLVPCAAVAVAPPPYQLAAELRKAGESAE